MRSRLAVACLVAAIVLGCTEGSDDSSAVSITSSTIVEIFSVEGQSATVDFNASASWTVSCSADWLSCSPAKGEAGHHTLKLMTTQTNRTKNTRKAQLTITSGHSYKTVTVIQGAEYAVFDQKNYTISPEGGSLVLNFKSNLGSSAPLSLAYSMGNWFRFSSGSPFTRATEWEGSTYEIIFQPNTSAEGRTAAFCLLTTDDNNTRLGLDTAYVYQPGKEGDYASTDYSADGKVSVIQRATAGKGIPVVLMGDGFADKDIADSTYYRVLAKTVENLFSEEPVKSLRHYFDVYSVTAVSKNRSVGSNFSTVFSCIPDYNSTNIEFDEDKVNEYTKKVSGVSMEKVLVIVIVNSDSWHGVTSMYTDPVSGTPLQHSICLFAISNQIDSEAFRQVIVHEAIGHGLGKLADEYGYEENGAITDNAARQLKWVQRYGWMLNVDTSADSSKVQWASFIGNSHFENERIGVYEGGYTYDKGVYRPSEESMMRNNDSPFNAPSRKIIYDKVMSLGEGRSASTIDEFVAFDEEHKPERWDYSTGTTRTLAPWQRRSLRLAPPIMKYLP